MNPREFEKKHPSLLNLSIISLLSLSISAFLGKSYENLLRGIDSNIHAILSLEVTSKDILPALPMHLGNQVFNDHPFFYFWMNGCVMRLLEHFSPLSAWSSRFLTGLFSSGAVFLVYLLGSSLHSSLLGILSALIFLFTRDVILTGASLSLDPPMLFFILLSFVFWTKGRWKSAGFTAGVGLWIKSPVVLLIFPVALFFLFTEHFRKKTFKAELLRFLNSFMIAIAIGSLVWIYTGVFAGFDLILDYWKRQVWGTAVQGRHFSFSADPWMFFKWLKNGFIPGLPLLFISLIQIGNTLASLRGKRMTLASKKHYHAAAVSVVTIFVVMITISSLRFRMDYYFNPAFPFLAILAAYPLEKLFRSRAEQLYQSVLAFTPIILSFLIIHPIVLGPEAFQALKKMIPFVQTYGSCEDKILLISGGEPFGSSSDYQLVLAHYTGRQAIVSDCAQVEPLLKNKEIQWIIASTDNANRCLSSSSFDHFLQMGQQNLFVRRSIPTSPFDLTPLLNELTRDLKCGTGIRVPR